MHYNSSNPLIPHASQSMQMQDYKMQILINSLARKIIKKEIAKGNHQRSFIISSDAIRIA